mgnify:FL=1
MTESSLFLPVSCDDRGWLFPADAGKCSAVYDSGNGILRLCDYIRCTGNDRTYPRRSRARAADRLHGNLPGSSAGMDFCRFVSDTGVLLLQEEGSEAV